MDEYYQVVQSLPSWLARPLLDMPSALAPDVQELRLRVGCAPAFTMRGAVCTPQEMAQELSSLQQMLLTPQQMEEILFTLCGGSVHTHQTEIAQGYVTGPSGCRAGLGGRFLQNLEQGVVLQELTSVNLRVAREKTIPLPQELCAAMQTHFIGMLLVGEPGSGKTTLLRSMARELVCQKKLVSVIDERRELFSGSSRQKSPGEALDVIAGMEIDLIFKIAAIGIIVAVLNQLLIRSGREDQAMMTTLAGLVVVLSILVKQISALFVTIKSLFAL